MNFNVEDRTILLVRSGSHAYGLNTPESDIDEKGVCIPPKEYYLGFSNKFEQHIREAKKGHRADTTIMALNKFMKLAAECNPNIIEVLHTDETDILMSDAFGKELFNHKDDFISQKAVHTFTGYAYGQIKKIKSHRNWLLNPARKLPSREDFGLPPSTKIKKEQLEAAMAAVNKKLQHWNFEDMSYLEPATRVLIHNTMAELLCDMELHTDDKFKAAARSIGFNENFLELLNKERAYTAAKNNVSSYNQWVAERNPERAEQEKKVGYDTKHGSHCLRLLRMCKEMLEGKGVIVKRTEDREELIAIKRHGSMSYEQLIEESEKLMTECKDVLIHTTKLPKAPDLKKLDTLAVNLADRYLSTYG